MSLSLIDTHAHINSSVMDVKKEIRLLKYNHNVSKIINVGIDIQTSIEAIKLSLTNDNIYATIGIHPLYEGSVTYLEQVYHHYDNYKVVAIGETGIDTNGNIDLQIDKFIDSIKLANKLSLPLIIHSNTIDNRINAHQICLEILKRYPPQYGFVFHCFQPDLDILKTIIDMNGYISAGSKITNFNAKKSLEVISRIPIDKLLIETDYPYLTDNPKQSGYETFNKICEIKQQNKIYIMNKLNDNAYKLFPKLYN